MMSAEPGDVTRCDDPNASFALYLTSFERRGTCVVVYPTTSCVLVDDSSIAMIGGERLVEVERATQSSSG